ncbi:hypothetical protein DPEC_G00261920 [Dallia pectoralis]|uniref:Uncharacterized protein n=1 Tax=Dallia pectoralis TaxID=75939 RepID=A0ACC2FS48_DALPE|nr:hypothetical protein DPEC_G00261920 [Dallia pectoralis]
MATMVCSLFPGGKTDVCASVDRLVELDVLDLKAVICSLATGIIFTPACLGNVGSVVGGWEVVAVGEPAVLDTCTVLIVAPVKPVVGDGGVRPVSGPSTKLSSGKRSGKAAVEERGFPAIGDASSELTRGAASENPIYTANINAEDMYIIKVVNLMFNFSSPCKAPSYGLTQTVPG